MKKLIFFLALFTMIVYPQDYEGTARGAQLDSIAAGLIKANGNDLILNVTGITLSDGVNSNDLVMDALGVALADFSDNNLTMDANGVLLSDGVNSNAITMDAAGLLLGDGVSNNNLTMDASGILLVDFSGNAVTMDANGVVLSDGTNSNAITMDAVGILLDDGVNGSNIAMDATGILLDDGVNGSTITMDANGISLDDGVNGNTVTMDASGISFDGMVKIPISTHIITTDSTLAAGLMYGGIFYVTEAQTITLPPVAVGMSATFITVGNVAVSINPDNADLQYLDGTALADGDKATNTSTAGDIIVFTFFDATGWYAASDGWTDGN